MAALSLQDLPVQWCLSRYTEHNVVCSSYLPRFIHLHLLSRILLYLSRLLFPHSLSSFPPLLLLSFLLSLISYLLRFVLILSSHPCLKSGLFRSCFPIKILYAFVVSPLSIPFRPPVNASRYKTKCYPIFISIILFLYRRCRGNILCRLYLRISYIASCWTTVLEYRPFSAVPDCLYNIFRPHRDNAPCRRSRGST